MMITFFQYYSRDKGPQAPVTVQIPGPYSSIASMQESNSKVGYWFQPQAKRFFRAKNHGISEGRFLFNSIQFEGSDGVKAPRQYKVNCCLDNGDMEPMTLLDEYGEYLEDFKSLSDVKSALTRLLKGAKNAQSI